MAYTTIDNPELFFQTLIWTGDGSGTKSFTLDGSENMQPDWVWSKARDSLGSITGNHFLYDSVRGAGAEKELSSNSTGAEGANANAQYGYISSFNTDGFTTTAGTSNNDYFNKSSTKYVAWNWKAGGSASSNSDGSITSSVSANTTAGFSIVSYTGTQSAATIGHGLGAVPGTLIIKNRSSTDNRDWVVYHKNLSGNNKYLSLNLTNAELTDAATFNNTAPTSTVFSSASSVEVNESSKTFIAYCFTEIKGYSKFGSYTGNGNADGGFNFLGFKPAMVILKRTDSSASWLMFDNKRGIDNVVSHRLYANASDAEDSDTGSAIDFLSNGFKNRSSDNSTNASGSTYIYMAFAESPFVNSNGVPNNAR